MRAFRITVPALLGLVAACAAGGGNSSGGVGGSSGPGGPGATTGTGSGVTTQSASTGLTGTTSTGAGGAAGAGGSGSTTGAGGAMDGGLNLFGAKCDGGSTKLTGTVYAPNGTDPLPRVSVYITDKLTPYPAHFCDKCSLPIDTQLAATKSNPDGTFTLDLDGVPFSPSLTFAIQIGRFRKGTSLPITPCVSAAAPKAATTLPGTSAAGDIPKIAVSTGNKDHLDVILAAIGITEFDCYDGTAHGTSTTCAAPLIPNHPIPDVLTNAAGVTPLDSYHMLFLGCAPHAFSTFAPTYGAATMAQNLASFVSGGGRMIATDTAYDYIEQAFPAAMTFQGPAAPAVGQPQPVEGADMGCVPASGTINATVDDPKLAAWLPVVGVNPLPSVAISGFLKPWAVAKSLPAGTAQIVDGVVPFDPTLTYTAAACTAAQADVPLTAEFDVNACGRVIYSSYHTLQTVMANMPLSAQEKILEYLIFEAAACHG